MFTSGDLVPCRLKEYKMMNLIDKGNQLIREMRNLVDQGIAKNSLYNLSSSKRGKMLYFYFDDFQARA